MSDEEIKAQIAVFNKERNEALLSMDEAMPRGAVHKAITGAMSLPIEFRKKSKAWLDEHGLRSFDDGEL